MICVTGSARCGTSMLMQTLIHLGYETPAPKFLKDHELVLDKNPKGFYELYDEVLGGVQHHNYKGMAIKLFGGILASTPKEYISKLIICLRDREDANNSYADIHKKLEEPYTPDYIYDMNYQLIYNYKIDINHIFITFDIMIENPKQEIERLVKFLGINPTKEQMLNAINNIG